MQREPAVGDSGGYRRAVFRRGAARISELHIDLADRHTTSMIQLDRIRQLEQPMLSSLGRRERVVILEFHLSGMMRVPISVVVGGVVLTLRPGRL
jgi:hypothetical protein